MGFGALWGSPPNGAHTPDLTRPSYSPGGPEKNSFYSGAIDPHLGEIWNFEIFDITVFEPILAMSLQRTRNVINLHVPSRRAGRKCSGRLSICCAPPRLRTRRVLRSIHHNSMTPHLNFPTRCIMGHWTQFISNGPRKLLSSNSYAS